ncbi:uncharacterized protein LOC118478382 [Aplysia californica]|uniref:Uncharacterized protein LOC118478382 n=1 Tax=Aplysia californica TaxID=6500 RepID=A0ABM1VZB3_APLCA|nr:uncharacterized protein LOC118478382 [Aplysia californica]
MVLDMFKEMDIRMKELKAKDKEFDAKITAIEAREQEMNYKLNDLRTRVENSKDAIISTTTGYRGHNYLLSKPILVNVHEANRLCRLYGGYLAEINDKQEFQHLADFSSSHVPGSVSIGVMLGATDEGHEGRWTFLTSGGNMTSFVWGNSEPSRGANQDCLYISTNSKTMMDEICLKYTSVWQWRFLCEINA